METDAECAAWLHKLFREKVHSQFALLYNIICVTSSITELI